MIRDAVEREIAAMSTTLKVLSTSELLRQADFAALHERIELALAGTGTYVILADPAYRQRLNTRVPYGTALGAVSDRASVDEALRTGKLHISDLFYGSVAKQFVINIALPVTTETGESYVLIMTRNADTFGSVLRELNLDPGWSGTLIDRSGKVIAAIGDDRTGEPAKFDDAAAAGLGSVQPVEIERDGARNVVSVRRSFITGWQAIAWVPASVIEAPMWNSIFLLALAGLGLLLLTALLSVLLARWVARPIKLLAGQARALGHGETLPVLNSPVREVNEVSQTLALASEERKKTEDHIRFLMRELSHRAKNQLAVVVAMARRTAERSRDLQDFEKVFSERLMALARSTDLLVNQNWRGVGLADLVGAHLKPFATGERSRLAVQGPHVDVVPEAAQNIGLALHELATNASKYGALSTPDGIVSVTWRINGGEEARLMLRWVESGGPPVTPPETTGFGSVVIARTVAQSLNAEARHEFHPGGVEWTLDVPLASIVART